MVNEVLTALSRIPVDEAGEPVFESVDPDTAWDAIVEQAQGDEATAAEVVADIVAERREDLKAAEKALKTKAGKPEKRKKGSPAPTMEERIAAKNAAKEAVAEAQAIRDRAKAALEHWENIADTKQRREAERRSAEDTEARRRAEERAAHADQGGESGAERAGGESRVAVQSKNAFVDKVTESEETDHNELPYIVSSNGTTEFGRIRENEAIPAGAIKLSVGFDRIDKDGKHRGYGLVHIDAQRGDAIRSLGFKSVTDFVEYVSNNYTSIKEGGKRAGKDTYILEIAHTSGDYTNVLYIELASEGAFWNVNSGGVFRVDYTKNKKVLEKTEEADNSLPAVETSSAAVDGEVQDTFLSGNPMSGNSSLSVSSDGKVTNSVSDKQEGAEEISASEALKREQKGGHVHRYDEADSRALFEELLGFAKRYSEGGRVEIPKLEREMREWLSQKSAEELIGLDAEMLRGVVTAAGLDGGKAWAFRMSIDHAMPESLLSEVWKLRNAAAEALKREQKEGLGERDNSNDEPVFHKGAG
ncbi:MAG: hypothetical protein K2L28_06090, partial [Muribaculaceae bacterium]|nr:hypothetical protein [Muribaculaceae bacterium]